MPNRILRDWTDSLAIDQLSAEAERFFTRLIQKADDLGRFHADPRMLKSALYPLKTDLCLSDVSQWLDECQTADVITPYTCTRGRKYLTINNFNQRTRIKKSKFPDPANQPPPHDRQTSDNRPLETETETIFEDGDGDGTRADKREQVAPPSPPSNFSQEIQETEFPDPLDTPAFRAIWLKWLQALAESRKKHPTRISQELHLATLAYLTEPHARATVQLSAANAWANFFPEKVDPAALPRPQPAAEPELPEIPEPTGWQDIWLQNYPGIDCPQNWADLPYQDQTYLTAKLQKSA